MPRQPPSPVESTPDLGVSTVPPAKLTLRDVRVVFRLLSEVRELGAAPVHWRAHVAAGLLRLTNADTCLAAEAVLGRNSRGPRWIGTVVAGLADPRLVSIYQALVQHGAFGFELDPARLANRTNTTINTTRSEIAVGRPWGQRSDWDPWRTLDCEYFICSNQYVPTWRCVHIIVLTRSSRRRAFNQREVRLVSLFHAELGRLLRQRQRHPDVGLAPQLRRTLECLASGLSEREVALQLGMSPHTVHDHVKRLYRRFQAHSRAQLLAQRTWGPSLRTPSLCAAELNGDTDSRFDAVELAEAVVGCAQRRVGLGRTGARASDSGRLKSDVHVAGARPGGAQHVGRDIV